MRLLVLTLAALFLSISLSGQKNDSLEVKKAIPDNQGDTAYSHADNILPDTVVGKSDTINIRLGNKKVRIIENGDKTSVIVKEKDEEFEEGDKRLDFDWEWDDEEENEDKSNTKFKGHWAGFEFGLNNYVDKGFSLNRSSESDFLDVNSGRSWNFNLNFAQYSIPFYSTRFGALTGLGLEWNNYHFSNANSIIKNPSLKQIEALPISGSIKKNRLQTLYLTIPVLIELQLLKKDRSDRIYFSGGFIAGLKLASQTKYKVSENGGIRSETDWDDYYLQPFRYGVTARAGYKLVKVYFNYYMTPLFIDGQGPEIYPVAYGLCLTF